MKGPYGGKLRFSFCGFSVADHYFSQEFKKIIAKLELIYLMAVLFCC